LHRRDAEDTEKRPLSISTRRFLLTILLSWLSMLGFDFFLNAGLLARLYLEPSPFLLPPAEAFRRVPAGYLSFLMLTSLLVWLMERLGVSGWAKGLSFGLALGAVVFGASLIALWSIATASALLLASWFVGQTLQLGIAAAVAGSGLAGQRPLKLIVKVAAFVLLMAVATLALQNAGLAPAIPISRS